MANWRDSDLIYFLQENNARVSCYGRSLVFDQGDWIVYDYPPYKKKPIILYRESFLSQSVLDILAGKEAK